MGCIPCRPGGTSTGRSTTARPRPGTTSGAPRTCVRDPPVSLTVCATDSGAIRPLITRRMATATGVTRHVLKEAGCSCRRVVVVGYGWRGEGGGASATAAPWLADGSIPSPHMTHRVVSCISPVLPAEEALQLRGDGRARGVPDGTLPREGSRCLGVTSYRSANCGIRRGPRPLRNHRHAWSGSVRR